jgi:ubiquitin carboxyl-terminal hydrolase 25/28
VLLEFVKTGRMGDMPMDLVEAYRMFGIDDRTTGDDWLVTCYNLAVEDNPGNIEQINRAIKAIADDRKTDMLQKLVGGKASAETPVGLQNIGNTCYLNSLLQYFFTVTILKKIVLDFDQYKQKLDDAEIRSKKVGRLAVKPQQVETAQKCTFSLQAHFEYY